MSRLVVRHSMRFGELAKSTTLSSGNLASHLNVLKEVGYVVLESVPNSVQRRQSVKVTIEGETQFRAYVERMLRMFGDLNQGSAPRRRDA